MQNRISDYTDRLLSPRTSETSSEVFTSLVTATGAHITPQAEDRFIKLSDLDAAIHEACSEYGLCEQGRDDMRRSLGIIPNVIAYEQDIRVDKLQVTFTGPPGSTLESLLGGSSLDSVLYRALDTELRRLAAEHPHLKIDDVDASADCYWNDPDEAE